MFLFQFYFLFGMFFDPIPVTYLILFRVSILDLPTRAMIANIGTLLVNSYYLMIILYPHTHADAYVYVCVGVLLLIV